MAVCAHAQWVCPLLHVSRCFSGYTCPCIVGVPTPILFQRCSIGKTCQYIDTMGISYVFCSSFSLSLSVRTNNFGSFWLISAQTLVNSRREFHRFSEKNENGTSYKHVQYAGVSVITPARTKQRLNSFL